MSRAKSKTFQYKISFFGTSDIYPNLRVILGSLSPRFGVRNRHYLFARFHASIKKSCHPMLVNCQGVGFRA